MALENIWTSLLTEGMTNKVSDGIGAKFNRFLSNIELTSQQQDDASTRHYAIRKKLEDAFPGSTTFVVGSYGKNTAIRPPNDLDIMLVLPQSTYDHYNSYVYVLGNRNAQSELLQEVKIKIQKYYPNTRMKADGQVVIVSFISSFSVEIVPCFRIAYSTKYKICDTKNGGRWQEVDPTGEKNAISTTNAITNGNTVRLIKMLKCWKRFCNVPLKSFYIEILAQDFLRNWEHKDKSSTYFDWMIRDFFKYLVDKSNLFYGTTIYHPSTYESINIGSDWASRAESAYSRACKACDAGDKYPYTALGEWQKIFGTDYKG